MADFNSDGCGGAVDPVFLKLAGLNLIEIFPTSYNAEAICRVLGSPSEKGTLQMDNKVVDPMKISFEGIVKYQHKGIFDKIATNLRKGFSLEKIKCTMFTKAGSYKNMLITKAAEVGDNHMYDAFKVRVEMVEYLEHGQ